jgi:hypothetical protein
VGQWPETKENKFGLENDLNGMIIRNDINAIGIMNGLNIKTIIFELILIKLINV